MKILSILFIVFTIITFGCKETENKKLTDKYKKDDLLLPISQPNLLQEPPVNDWAVPYPNARIATVENKKAFSSYITVLKRKLDNLAPIPIPAKYGEAKITSQQADLLYRSFINKYAGDPILPLFKQRYARVLLLNYKLLTTGDDQTVGYYIDQLIKAKSFDYKLIAKGLTKIKGTYSVKNYKSMLNEATSGAEKRYEVELKLLPELRKSIARFNQKITENPDDRKSLFWLKLLKNTEQQLEASEISASVTQLHKLSQ